MGAPASGADLTDPVSVDCPRCGATSGEPCTVPARWAGPGDRLFNLPVSPHDERHDELADWRDVIRDAHSD